jgi:hypothetical protein
MTREIRQRIVRPATPEERDRHQGIREQIDQEFPELQQWARQAVAHQRDRIAIGTVLSADETHVVAAIDEYAESHALHSRSAVVREALANLLGIQIARQ